MKIYTKPTMEIVDLKVEESITAPTTFYKRGKSGINLLKPSTSSGATSGNTGIDAGSNGSYTTDFSSGSSAGSSYTFSEIQS